MNLFDSVQSVAGNIVSKTFGYSAIWEPLDNSPAQNAIVLYKDATEKKGLSDQDYTIERYLMEFKKNEFTGLKKSVDNGNLEKVKIEISENNILTFFVRRIETKYDGKTIVAILNTPDEEI